MDYNQIYGDIIAKYPSSVNQKQMAEICKVSVRTVRNLMKNSMIPFQRRIDGLVHWYEIQLTDVLRYLYEKECYQESDKPYMIKLKQFYTGKLNCYPDVITVQDIVKITGYSDTAIINWINKGALKSYKGKKYKIPKIFVINFLCGAFYRQIRRKTVLQKITTQEFLETL